MLKITYYIFRQLTLTTLFLTILLTAAVWLTQSLRFVDGILNKGLPFNTFFYIISMLLPDLVSIVLPPALLIAVIYTYNRLIADQELVVMRSAGMSQWQLAKPAVILACLVSLFLYALNIYILPNAYQKMRDIEHASQNTISSKMIQEGEFNSLKGLMVYVRKRINQKDMKGILIYNNRDKEKPFLITAETGSLVKTEEGTKLILINGARQDMDRTSNNPSMLYFDQYMVELESPKTDEAGRKRSMHEHSLLELLYPDESKVKPHQLGKYKAHGHQRVLNPLHALAFTLIALAFMLHGQVNRRRRTKKVVTIVGLAFTLEILVLGLTNLAEHYWISMPLAYVMVLLAIGIASANIIEWITSVRKPRSLNLNKDTVS